MLATLGRALVGRGGQTGGPVGRIDPRIGGDNDEPLRGSFSTELDGIAARLGAAARLTISSYGASLDAENHRPEQATAGRQVPKNHR
jgi:hypothetical protein